MRLLTKSTILVLAAFVLSSCQQKGLEIVKAYPISPTVLVDDDDDLRYYVAVKNYGSSPSSQSVQLYAQVNYTSSTGASCSYGSSKGWYSTGALAPDEHWSSGIGPKLEWLTQHPSQCPCKKGSCSGSVKFYLFTDHHQIPGSKIVPGNGSEIQMNFNQNAIITGYVVTPH